MSSSRPFAPTLTDAVQDANLVCGPDDADSQATRRQVVASSYVVNEGELIP